jgi:hypothetical protein
MMDMDTTSTTILTAITNTLFIQIREVAEAGYISYGFVLFYVAVTVCIKLKKHLKVIDRY